MKSIKVILIAILCFASGAANGDVIRLKDGTIFLGEIKNVDSDGVLIESFGVSQSISQSDILKTEKDLSGVSGKKIEVELKDASRIKGRINNYDNEIGLFVMTEFGSITIASGAIKSIADIQLRNKIIGYEKGVGLQAGVAFPTGSRKSNFDMAYVFQGYFEHTSIYIRELFIGLDFTYKNLKNSKISKLTYDIVSMQPYLIYRTRFFKKMSVPVINEMVPFVLAGAGLTFVTMHDDRLGGNDSAELVTSYKAGAGIDYDVFSPVAVRLCVSNEWIMEGSGSFSSFHITMGARLGF